MLQLSAANSLNMNNGAGLLYPLAKELNQSTSYSHSLLSKPDFPFQFYVDGIVFTENKEMQLGQLITYEEDFIARTMKVLNR